MTRFVKGLVGADPAFVNHVIRSPLFIAGWHRRNPLQSSSCKKISLDDDSLFHFSKWYNPKAYTLDEMGAIADDLYKLHVRHLGNKSELLALESKYHTKLIFNQASPDGSPSAHSALNLREEPSKTDYYSYDKDHTVAVTSHQPKPNATKKFKLTRQQALVLNPLAIIVGERNDSLFEHMRYRAYGAAFQFKQHEDLDGFLSYLLPIAYYFNNRLLKPLG